MEMDNIKGFQTSVVDDLCCAVMLEQTMKRGSKKNIRNKELTKTGYSKPFSCAGIVDITDKPVTLDDFKNHNPNIRATMGKYYIKYMNKADKWRSGDKAWAINQDLVPMSVHVSGPRHWHCVCKRIPELGWLERNSTLTDALFGIAKKHPGVVFTFTLDWVRYADMITEKAAEQGLDIDNKPFLSYMCSKAEYEKRYADKEFPDRKTKYDYRKELKEAYAEAKGEK